MIPSKVIIDGVLYVPAQSVQVANSKAIKIALLSKFWGDVSGDSDDELADRWSDVYIDVTDSPRTNDSEILFTIEELIDTIAAIQKKLEN
jgi:hypothetical protein